MEGTHFFLVSMMQITQLLKSVGTPAEKRRFGHVLNNIARIAGGGAPEKLKHECAEAMSELLKVLTHRDSEPFQVDLSFTMSKSEAKSGATPAILKIERKNGAGFDHIIHLYTHLRHQLKKDFPDLIEEVDNEEFTGTTTMKATNQDINAKDEIERMLREEGGSVRDTMTDEEVRVYDLRSRMRDLLENKKDMDELDRAMATRVLGALKELPPKPTKEQLDTVMPDIERLMDLMEDTLQI